MSDTITEISKNLKQFALKRDWEQFHTPKNLSMALIAETAELVEHFQWLTPQQSRAVSGEKLKDISHEMADIFIYLLRMAEQLDIDLIAATREKMAINEKRFPEHSTTLTNGEGTETEKYARQNHKDNKYTE